jgi:protein TonB
MERKKPSTNLRNYYTVFLQSGIVVVLLIFIAATKVEFVSENKKVDLTEEQEITKMEEVIQTEQEEKPPPPPPSQVPVEVPNDEIIEDQNISLNADMNMDEPLEMPPPPEEEDFFVAVGDMPEVVGGQQGIYDNVQYPEQARRAGIEGRVIIQFTVGKDGKANDFKVIRGLQGGCNEAAIAVLKKAEFKPGQQRGQKVRVRMSQSINFQLRN